MMNIQRFEQAKRAILKEMVDSKAHCADSIYAVKQCTSIRELAKTLNKFVKELRYKRFPSAELLRTYFDQEVELLNEVGIYIDQEVNIFNKDNVWLFGHCTGTVSSNVIRYINIVVNDDAEVTINAMPWALQHIYIKSPHEAYVKFNKSPRATQIITQNKAV